MRQDVPGKVDIVRCVGDRDITVEFDILQTKSISAPAAAIQSPERQLRDVDVKVEVESTGSICRYCDARRGPQSYGAAGCVTGIPEIRCNRVRARCVAVIMYFDFF